MHGCHYDKGTSEISSTATGGSSKTAIPPGKPLSTNTQTLNTMAGLVQEFAPLKNICGFLNAFHLYADEPTRFVEAHHYCASVNEDFRQCLIYDSNEKNARLIGVEYMITPKLYETLDESERRLWHSHVFEIKSGMLIMPKPPFIPESVWEIAENKEMEQIIQLYGKIYHLWQIDRGDALPIGAPKLMTSVTEESEIDGELLERIKERDRKFVADFNKKREMRKGLKEPEIHPDADQCKKKASTGTSDAKGLPKSEDFPTLAEAAAPRAVQ